MEYIISIMSVIPAAYEVNPLLTELSYLNLHPLEVVSRYRDPQSQVDENCSYLFKAAPWNDINFRFYFRTEVVYPTDHVFIFFRIFLFLQIFLINISMKPEVTQTNYLYT